MKQNRGRETLFSSLISKQELEKQMLGSPQTPLDGQ